MIEVYTCLACDQRLTRIPMPFADKCVCPRCGAVYAQYIGGLGFEMTRPPVAMPITATFRMDATSPLSETDYAKCAAIDALTDKFAEWLKNNDFIQIIEDRDNGWRLYKASIRVVDPDFKFGKEDI